MENRSSNKFAKKYLLLILLIVLLNIAGGIGYYYYNQYQSVIAKTNPNITADKQIKDLVAKVGKLILLPKDQTPTVATVNDVSKLKGQTFFANASNGDKVLIYMKEKKAILYNPTLNIIVDVAPVNDQTQQASAPESGKPVIKSNKLFTNTTATPTPTLMLHPTVTSAPTPTTLTPVPTK